MHFSFVQPILSCESRYVESRWKRSREFLQISFWDISSAHCGLWNALSVLQFCRSEHLEVAPSWWRSSGLRKGPIAIGENVGWLHFLSRDVHKCKTQFLDSNKEGILGIALSELFRITRTTQRWPFHESLLFILHWMVCRRYCAANQLEVLVDEDDSRSSSQVRQYGNFLLVSQLHVAIQTLWSQCLFSSALCEQTDGFVHFQRDMICVYVFVCVFVLILASNRHLHTTGQQVSMFFHWCFRSQVRNVFDFLNTRTGLLLWQKQVSLF